MVEPVPPPRWHGLTAGVPFHVFKGPAVDRFTGADIWRINADEALLLDYNTEFNPDGLWEAPPYRSSDHTGAGRAVISHVALADPAGSCRQVLTCFVHQRFGLPTFLVRPR